MQKSVEVNIQKQMTLAREAIMQKAMRKSPDFENDLGTIEDSDDESVSLTEDEEEKDKIKQPSRFLSLELDNIEKSSQNQSDSLS